MVFNAIWIAINDFENQEILKIIKIFVKLWYFTNHIKYVVKESPNVLQKIKDYKDTI